MVDLEDEGDVLRYCVALDSQTVSGVHLVELAGEQFDLSYRFGFGGQAVCMLAGVGPEGDDCFADYPDFWGYWRGDGLGGWTWSGSGPAATSVSAGDVEGWSWGSGADGTTHPAPPQTTYRSVCGEAPEPPSEGSGEKRASSPRRTGEPGAAAPDTQPEEADRSEPSETKRKRARSPGSSGAQSGNLEPRSGSPAAPRATGSPSGGQELPAVASGSGERPPPVAGFVGVAIAALLALGAGILARRRRA